MVFTKLLLENALAIQPCNYDAASEPLLPKVARFIPALSSRYVGKCAAGVLKRLVQLRLKSDALQINSSRQLPNTMLIFFCRETIAFC